MTTNECKTIRQELDEADPNQQLSNSAAEHLRSCSNCSAFASDHQVLRGLIATLQPVAAPADFDFRLRARLAREKSHAQNGAGIANFLRIPTSVAAAALVLLMGVAGVIIKNRIKTNTANLTASNNISATAPNAPAPTVPPNRGTEDVKAVAAVTGAGNPGSNDSHFASRLKHRAARTNPVVVRQPEIGVREFAVSPASVVLGEQVDKTGSVVRVPLDTHSLQISIDDGRGETRTISLPRVSFGSQRLVASQSFLPSVSPTKGVW